MEIARVLKPGGRLYLTTSNPSTLMNAWRVITDRYEPRGAEEFAVERKFDGTTVTSNPEIHYREYTSSRLHSLLERAGFRVVDTSFIILGSTRRERTTTTWLRRLPDECWGRHECCRPASSSPARNQGHRFYALTATRSAAFAKIGWRWLI
jgi:hypothetical protein